LLNGGWKPAQVCARLFGSVHEYTREWKVRRSDGEVGGFDALRSHCHFIAHGDALSVGRDAPPDPEDVQDSVRAVVPEQGDVRAEIA
jgi:hypothetical protein